MVPPIESELSVLVGLFRAYHLARLEEDRRRWQDKQASLTRITSEGRRSSVKWERCQQNTCTQSSGSQQGKNWGLTLMGSPRKRDEEDLPRK
jgi:hypothetical protein